MTFVWLRINYTWQWNPNVSLAIFMYMWSWEVTLGYRWSCEVTLGYMVAASLQLGAKVTVAMRLGVGTKNICRQNRFSRRQSCQVTGAGLSHHSSDGWEHHRALVPHPGMVSIEGYCKDMRCLCFYLLFFPHPFLPNLALHIIPNQSENCCQNHIYL